jgi:hypothetical protein
MEVLGSCAHLPDMEMIAARADHPQARLCGNSNPQNLEGEGLEHHFQLVLPSFGQTLHIHELDDPKSPSENPSPLLLASDDAGWILLEASSQPADRVTAMTEQRELGEKALAKEVDERA